MISYIILGILIFLIGFGLLKRSVYELRLCEGAALAVITLIILLNIIPPLIFNGVYFYFAFIPLIITGLYLWLSTKNLKLIALDFAGVAIVSACLIVFETFMPVKDFEYLHMFLFVLIASVGGVVFSSSFRGAVTVSYLSALTGSVYYFYVSGFGTYILGGGIQLDLIILSFTVSALLYKIFGYFTLRKLKAERVNKFEAGEIYNIDDYREKENNGNKNKRKKD